MEIAAAIRHWNFHGLVIEHFWGLPYLMALLSTLTRMSDRAALLVICIASSFLSVALAYELWDGWVASFFALLSFDWIQRSYLGGSETPFVALLFASFLAVRKQRWMLATALASLATLCRPLGIFALIGIGLTLLYRREFVKCAAAVGIGAAIGIAYMLPLKLYFGNALANVHGYDPDGSLFGIPFYAIIKGTIVYPAPWTNLILSFGWIAFATLGMVAMAATRRYHDYFRNFSVENIFAVLYIASVYCYNRPYWARGSFPRFIIPALPFILFALSHWLPKDRRVLWALAICTPVLSAVSAIGLTTVVAAIRRML